MTTVMVVVGSILLLPSLFLPFSLIDDGGILRISSQIINSITNKDFAPILWIIADPESGRIRPIYWLFQTFRYLLFDHSTFLFHLSQILIIITPTIITYILVRRYTKSQLVSTLSVLFFLSFSPIFENFYRLGPQEPIVLFFMSLSVAFLSNKKLFVSLVFLYLAFFTKETTFFLLTASWLCYYLTPKNKLILRYNILFTVISLCMIIIAWRFRSITQNYTSHYSLNLMNISYSVRTYTKTFFQIYLPSILILATISLLFASLRRTRHWQLSLVSFTIFVSNLVVQLPWAFPLGRYLLIGGLGLSIFLSIEMLRILAFIKSKPKPISLPMLAIFYYLLANYLFANLEQIYSFSSNFLAKEKTNSQYINQLATFPYKSNIYINLSETADAREWFEQSKIQLSTLYHRPDISLIYLREIPTKGSYFADWTEFRYFQGTDLNNILDHSHLIYTSSLVGYTGMTNMSRIIKDLLKGALIKNGLDHYLSSHTYAWKIYQVTY